MQDHEQQIIHLYMAVNGLLSVLSLIMYLFCAYVVLANGCASTERTLIGIGVVLQVIAVVLSLSVTLLPNLLNVTPGQYGLIGRATGFGVWDHTVALDFGVRGLV